MNGCVNSPEDGPVGPKHVEIRQYINKIEIVTSVGFYSIFYMEFVFNEIIRFLYKIIIIFSNHNALLRPKGPNPLLQYQISNKQN